MLISKSENKNIVLIWVLSFSVPLLVAFLMFMPQKIDIGGDWVRLIPHVNGLLNSFTAIALIAGLFAIKNNNLKLHKRLMLLSFLMGSLFLIFYVIYHSAAESTLFGDANRDGMISEEEALALGYGRMVYLVILISHIILAAIVVPFVLLALYYGYIDNRVKHKKIVKYTFPIWLYVSISGVIVYLMIRQYY